MKKLIINADDFGLSKSINKGVIESYQNGVLTSASLMVNMPGFEDALNMIKMNPGLGIGLHLNFFRGLPLSPEREIMTLVNERGKFLQNISEITARIYLRRLSLIELERELDIQIKTALNRGVKISHLDSEKHLHLINPVYRIVVRLAKKYSIDKIRNINSSARFYAFLIGKRYLFRSMFGNTAILKFLASGKKEINRDNQIKTTDAAFSLTEVLRISSNKYEELFNSFQEGTTELFCHPGYIDSEWNRPPLSEEKFYVNLNRENELKTLLSGSLREAIMKLKIELINYYQL